MSSVKMMMTAYLTLVALLVGLGTAIGGCGRGYSDGQRSGVIVKFSKKGIFCKTYEGQLNLGGTTSDKNGNMVPSVWEFTVVDEKLVNTIVAAQDSGRHVTLTYTQWLFPPPCSMDSQYEITGVK